MPLATIWKVIYRALEGRADSVTAREVDLLTLFALPLLDADRIDLDAWLQSRPVLHDVLSRNGLIFHAVRGEQSGANQACGYHGSAKAYH